MNTLRRSILAGVSALALVAAFAAAPKVGQPFVNLGQEKLEGALPDTKGKVVLVDFWASWCGPCRHSFPALQELYAKYKDQGLVVLGVNLDADKADMDEFLKKMKVEFPNVRDLDGKLAEKLQVTGIPATFLVGRSGNLLAIHEGYGGESSKKKYASEIEKALAEK